MIRGPLSRILHGLSEMIDPHTEAGHLTDAELAEKVNTRVWTPIKPDGAIDEAELRRPAETSEPTTWEVVWVDCEAFREVDEVCCREQQHRFRVLVHDPHLWGIVMGSRPSNITLELVATRARRAAV